MVHMLWSALSIPCRCMVACVPHSNLEDLERECWIEWRMAAFMVTVEQVLFNLLTFGSPTRTSFWHSNLIGKKKNCYWKRGLTTRTTRRLNTFSKVRFQKYRLHFLCPSNIWIQDKDLFQIITWPWVEERLALSFDCIHPGVESVS